MINRPAPRRSFTRQVDTTVYVQLEQPVERLLQQPGEEARTCFKKIFDAFGESPLLGLSAIGGLVALFAFAKAHLELDTDLVDAVGLISAGDVADFSIRLSVPFALLVGAAAALVGGWILLLTLDHRRPLVYVPAVLAVEIAYLLCLYLFFNRAPNHSNPLLAQSLGLAALGGSLLLLVPAARLVYLGQTKGIIADDRFQRGILFGLPALLFGLFAFLGVCLLAIPDLSVLFDRGLPTYWKDGRACYNDLLLMEVKSYRAPVVIRKRMTRLGSMWLVQRVDVLPGSRIKEECEQAVGPTDETTAAGVQYADRKDLHPRWLFVRQEDVSCVRTFDEKSVATKAMRN